MSNHVNLLSLLFAENKHSDEIVINAQATVNALTSETINATLAHIQARKALPEGTDDVPTLDQRNELDAAQQGEELTGEARFEQGFDDKMPPHKIAEICDGLRHTVYEELHRFGDFPLAENALLYTPKRKLSDPINWDLPMSAEQNIDFRIKMSAVPDDKKIAIFAAETGDPVEMVRAIMAKDAARESARLVTLKPQVMEEIFSLEGVYDQDGFMALPLATQIRVAQKIAAALDRRYKAKYAAAVKTGSLERMNELKLIKANWIETKAWLDHVERVSSAQLQG